MRPTVDDFVTVNGVKYPNFSLNKNRQPADNVLKVSAAKIDQDKDSDNGGELLLEKDVDANSRYSKIHLPL